MIELLWIAIAALGCWNVYYAKKQAATKAVHDEAHDLMAQSKKLHDSLHDSILELFDVNSKAIDEINSPQELEFKRTVTAAMQRMDDRLKTEAAKREELETALRCGAILMHPGHLENLYRWMMQRNDMEHDPEFILRSREGGCGGH